MITARRQKNLVTAKLYFREHLQHGDGSVAASQGQWVGRGVARLGLDPNRHVTLEAFERLCDNVHPQTGLKLTVRQRTEDRRVFFDFVIAAPKSVSILALTAGDQRLIKLHDLAWRAAVERMEQFAATRVRTEGKDEDRITGEIVAAAFRHDCSRALDPHLHTHLVVFNATWDSAEQRWKALQPARMFEALNFFTEIYRSELAAGLKDLGYRLRRTRTGFEIEGVSPELIRRFSKRRRQIEEQEPQVAEKFGRPLRFHGLANIARATRDEKRNIFAEDLNALQRSQLSSNEQAELSETIREARGVRTEAVEITPAQALDHARDHLFERASTTKQHELLREALIHGRGDVRLEDLTTLLPKRTEFVHVGERLTTKETLRLERELITWVNAQAGRYRPFSPTIPPALPLNEAQQRTLAHLLRSTDGVTRIGGGAGTGKTSVLKPFVSQLEARGHQVFVCAPTAAAVDVLRRDGFFEPQTVQSLLKHEATQREIAGHVILVDEANLLSVSQVHALFRIARDQRCRVVLSGDTRQHHSVEAGDALRVLETHSQLRSVSLDEIVRQKPVQYKAAVAHIAAGGIAEGYERLDRLGAIVETREGHYKKLADEFTQSLKRNRSALVVSPTWREIAEVTEAVRARLKNENLLGCTERTFEVHESLDWTEAQRRDTRNYRSGLILRFHKRTERFVPGEWARVTHVKGEKIFVRKASGKKESVTKKQARCFDVAQTKTLPISPGERLLIQSNCRQKNLINGQIVEVNSIDQRGVIHLKDGRVIGRGFRSFTHGYCVTSHGAEGKTVDHVYLAASSMSFRAAHREQFYVSVSRGRYKARIFTDDRVGLLDAVRASAARLTAVELVRGLNKPAHRVVVANTVNTASKSYVAPKVASL